MTEHDILTLIYDDPWMMRVLGIAEKLQLPDWVIGAGFVRNKVWDHLHGFQRPAVATADIDLVYFDPSRDTQASDEALSHTLEKQTGMPWEVVNQAYAHKWNNLPPYHSTKDALAHWPETATGIGVRLTAGKLHLVAPHGVDDLVHLIVRPSPHFHEGLNKVRERIQTKGWKTHWPKLQFVDV